MAAKSSLLADCADVPLPESDEEYFGLPREGMQEKKSSLNRSRPEYLAASSRHPERSTDGPASGHLRKPEQFYNERDKNHGRQRSSKDIPPPPKEYNEYHTSHNNS